MKNNKKIATILCFSIVFSILFIGNVPKAKAWPVSGSFANMLPEGMTTLSTTGQYTWNMSSAVVDTVARIGLVGAKVAALLTIQAITQAIIGDGGGGGAITDWKKYLYVNPQQQAMTQMNTFFNTVSRGRLSTLNYEGIGPNYDAYLVSQSKQAIAGQSFTTDLQDLVTDPKQVFDGGNTKGLVTYLKCANNVACYTLTSTAQYNLEYAKAQEIAKKEQSNGILPVKKNGVIVQPAIIAQSALTAVDQLGTQMITSANYADGTASLIQVAAGASISLAARTLNYSTASTQGKTEIANKNNQFPFSLSYSSMGGVSIK